MPCRGERSALLENERSGLVHLDVSVAWILSGRLNPARMRLFDMSPLSYNPRDIDADSAFEQ